MKTIMIIATAAILFTVQLVGPADAAAQTRNKFEQSSSNAPAVDQPTAGNSQATPTESAQPVQSTYRRPSRKMEKTAAIIRGTLDVICVVSEQCSPTGFYGSGRTEYPTTAPTYNGGSVATAPIFPYRPGTSPNVIKRTGRTAYHSTPSGWQVYQGSSSKTIAEPGQNQGGNLKNGVILGYSSGSSSAAIASELVSQNTYLRSNGSSYSASIGGARCEMYRYSGYSPSSMTNESVEVYICSASAGERFYAISVVSGQYAEYYKQQNAGIIFSARF